MQFVAPSSKRRYADYDVPDIMPMKRHCVVSPVGFPSLRQIQSSFRYFCVSQPNEHCFNTLLLGALKWYHTDALRSAQSLVLVKFDEQLFSDATDRLYELVPVDLFDEFVRRYKDTALCVPLHGVAFRGHDLRVSYDKLVAKVIDGRVDPVALIWESVTAGIEAPIGNQLRWAIEHHFGVEDMMT